MPKYSEPSGWVGFKSLKIITSYSVIREILYTVLVVKKS